MKQPGEEEEVGKERETLRGVGLGEQGEEKRDKSEEAGGRETEMKRGTIKDSRVCGGSVKAGGL